MRINIKKTAFLVLMLVFYTGFNISCSNDPGDSVVLLPESFNIQGNVQKGPFVKDTPVLIQELNTDFSPTDSSFQAAVTDDFGFFSISADLVFKNVEITAEGSYFNEISGELSASTLKLSALADLSEGVNININLLSTLAKERILHLISSENKSFQEAQTQAEREVLDVFHISGDAISSFSKMNITEKGDSNAILLAASLILLGNNTAAQLSELIFNISSDLKRDGTLDTATYIAEIKNNSTGSLFSSVTRNMENRYNESGFSLTLPDFEDFIDADGDGVINRDDYVLVSPNATSNDSLPAFDWTDSGITSVKYHIQIASDSEFNTVVENATDLPLSEYEIQEPLLNGITYHWRVFAIDEEGLEQNFGGIKTLTIDLGTVTLSNPSDNSRTSDIQPFFTWEDPNSANRYLFQLSTDSDFTEIVEEKTQSNILTSPRYQLTTLLNANTTYFWRIAITDRNDIAGAWTARFSFITPEPPVAEISLTNQTLFTGFLIVLSGINSSDPDFDRLTYIWSSQSKPAGSSDIIFLEDDPTVFTQSFRPDLPGVYNICLIVNDGMIDSAPVCSDINIGLNTAPVADAGDDQDNRTLAVLILLDGSGSSDPDGNALTYQWTVAAKPAESLFSFSVAAAGSLNPTVTPDKKGIYGICLIVSDSMLESTQDCMNINVTNDRPIAEAGTDQLVVTGETVILDASASSDINNDTLTYSWTRVSGPSVTLANPALSTSFFTPANVGEYTFKLVVNDSILDSAPDTVTKTALTISTIPASSAVDTAIGNAISIEFSRDVSITSFSLADSDDNNIPGASGYNNQIATFTPSADLINTTLYTATAGFGITDSDNNFIEGVHSWSFRTVNPPLKTSQISPGFWDHSCALIVDGSVKCWGANWYGKLGLGDTIMRGNGPNEMGDNLTAVDLGTGRTATQIATGHSHTCALLNDGSVKCWGEGLHGQLGSGSTTNLSDDAGEMGDNLTAVNLGTGRTATQLNAGVLHSCVLLDNSTVKCWGYNTNGQLGLGDTSKRGDDANEMGDNLTAVNLGTGRTATQLDAGETHTCALLDDASVKCWGGNATGQLGLGDTTNRGDDANEMGDNLTALNLGTGRTATQIKAGKTHTCALLDDASVKCWGGNAAGQLGQGDTTNRGDDANEMGDNLPAVNLGTGRTATQIEAGPQYTCALLDDASVKCWGGNTEGQLGQGDTTNRGDDANEMGDNLTAVNLGTGRTATQLRADGIHPCVLFDDGSVKCWGYNERGQLGLGDTNNRGDDAGEMGDNLPFVDLGLATP